MTQTMPNRWPKTIKLLPLKTLGSPPISSTTLHSPLQTTQPLTFQFNNISTPFFNFSFTCQDMAKSVAQSPLERNSLASFDPATAKQYAQDGVVAGAKAALVAGIATAIPTMASVRMFPWARANLNPTAQALIVSTAAGAAYFIVADKTNLATARRNSFKQGPDFEVSPPF